MSGFSFGGAASTPAPGGFSFGNAAAQAAAPVAPTTAAAPAPGGFSFGAPPNQTASTGFSFGATATTQASSFSFKPNPTAATVPAGAPLGSAIAATTTAPAAAPSGFSFGLGSTPAPATTTSSTAALSLSTPAAPKPLAFGVASTVANSSMKFGSVVPTTAAATASSSSGGFSFGMPSASNPTIASTPASLGLSAATASVPTTTPAPLFGAGNSQLTAPPTTSTSLVTTSSSSAAAAPSLSLGGASSSIAATTSSVAASASLGLSTSTLTTSSAAAASATAASLNYRQLEEAINKWTLELEEQEKVFLNQATQVNAWDRMLMDNGEKIVKLHESVEKVKLDQQRLEHELDFVKSQQSELDEILRPLEGSLSDAPPPDAERERIYSLAENLDAQLQRMGDDLREIIEHLNSANRNTNDNDPIVQISRVLNAHMDALQWVDQTSNLVQRKLEDVTKLQGIRRKENERIGIL